ncbi:MAG TPA: hypothetical protein VJQ57_15845 [Acidimicrobiia bacterium]|nr:hypothetical protein [Acidimicrobiia bacterium]
MREIVLRAKHVDGDMWSVHVESWGDPADGVWDCAHFYVERSTLDFVQELLETMDVPR